MVVAKIRLALSLVLFWAIPATAIAGDEAIVIGYVGHASFTIEAADGTRLLIDPYASRVWIGYSFPGDITADAILITHPHYDHDGGRYRGLTPPWGEAQLILDSPGEYRVGPFVVAGIEGKHADPYGKEFGQINTIWRIEVAGLVIGHIGDNRPLTEANLAALEGVDILMLPVDDLDHILPMAEVLRIWHRLKPARLLPMHYRLGDLEAEGEPGDLGGIDGFLAAQTGVRIVGSHLWRISAADLDGEPEIIVLDHDPRLKP